LAIQVAQAARKGATNRAGGTHHVRFAVRGSPPRGSVQSRCPNASARQTTSSQTAGVPLAEASPQLAEDSAPILASSLIRRSP
jgi:hypothetical protein